MAAQPFICGLDTAQVLSLPYVAPENYCFNTDYVIDGCVPIHLGINLHFFLNDSCDRNSVALDSGTLARLPNGDLNTTQAIVIAEQLVDDVNAFFASMSDNAPWNNIYHGVPEAGPTCIPLRLVLTGVYFHCKTSADTISGSAEISPFLVNPNTQLNYFLSDLSSPVVGFANRLGGTYGAQQTLSSGIFAHELMHIFNLNHVFYQDGCDDTWGDVNLTWDYDQDGIVDLTIPRCYHSSLDTFPDGRDPCNPDDFIVTHPCCEWAPQNNNLMTYSTWGYNSLYSALTACQLNRSIEHIAAHKCDYILGIDGCAPVSAFVVSDPSAPDCGACIDMRASDNETFFELDIANAQGTLVHDGPTIQGQAGIYCLRSTTDKYGAAHWPMGYATGQAYTATLSAWNDCGQSSTYSYTFLLPDPCSTTSDPVPIQVEAVLNPPGHPGTVAVNIQSPGSGTYAIYGSHLDAGTDYGQVAAGLLQPDEACETLVDIGLWSSGIFAVTVQVADEVHSFQFYKS